MADTALGPGRAPQPRLLYRRSGDAAAALMPIRERVLGPDHPSTLSARHELARWTGEAGNPVSARDQFAALLPIRERVLGPDTRWTLATRRNLDYWTDKAAD